MDQCYVHVKTVFLGGGTGSSSSIISMCGLSLCFFLLGEKVVLTSVTVTDSPPSTFSVSPRCKDSCVEVYWCSEYQPECSFGMKSG